MNALYDPHLAPTPAPTHAAALASKLRADFVWGAATSAAQIEGGAFEGGKGPSIWDDFCRQPGKIVDGSTIDVACNHLTQWREDIALMRQIGLGAYRFSISWPRVQPLGQGAWNEEGFAFYDRLIDGLLAAGIKPHLTLYHWDLPLALHQLDGGLLSRNVAPRFAAYAAEVARRFGDRVCSIATLNEPLCSAWLGYEVGQFAPGHTNRREAFQVAHHLLLMHAQAMQAMRAVTRAKLGIVLNHTPAFAAEATEADRRAARLADGLDVRWYMDPLFRGHYPQDVLAHLGPDAPLVQPGDLELMQQPLDFLGLNFYTRQFISTTEPKRPPPGQFGFTDMGWEIYPKALTQHLVRLTREYSPPPIYITENGMAAPDVMQEGRVHDEARIRYLHEHLQAIARACELGADVRGYFYWSLLDNFEWNSGYTKRFGLVHVDYQSQRRTLKDSAHWYREFLAAAR